MTSLRTLTCRALKYATDSKLSTKFRKYEDGSITVFMETADGGDSVMRTVRQPSDGAVAEAVSILHEKLIEGRR